MDTSGLVTLKSIIDGVLFKSRRGTEEYKRFFQIAIDGMRRLSLVDMTTVNTIKKVPNDLGFIDLPSDYINFVGLYINQNGTLWSLTERNDMIPTVTLQSGAETQDSTIGEGKSLSTGEDDGFSTRGGMNDYYYRVDKKERRILVNGLPRPTVYLAYVSSGISISADEVFIPVECKASIETYILWQDALFNTQINKAAIGEYKRMFREEEMLLRSLQFPTVDQIMDIFYSSYTNTPKR